MKKATLSFAAILFSPLMVLAQYDTPVTDARTLFEKLGWIGNMLIVFLIGLAVIFIVWNTVQFIMHAGGESRAEYQKGIIWGIVGLFIIMSIWGLVAILSNTFGISNAGHEQGYSQDVHSLILQ